MENFVWETAELGATTRRADIDALKAFVSAGTVTVRRPYGKFDVKRPALASLIGTINDSCGFLADTTGNRRFLISTIRSIDWRYADEVRVSEVWGQAFVAYQQGEVWLPMASELQLSEEINANFMLPNPLDGYLERYFILDATQMDPGKWWLPTSDIVALLFKLGYRAATAKGLAMEVAATLGAWGHLRYRKRVGARQVVGYLGIQENLGATTVTP